MSVGTLVKISEHLQIGSLNLSPCTSIGSSNPAVSLIWLETHLVVSHLDGIPPDFNNVEPLIQQHQKQHRQEVLLQSSSKLLIFQTCILCSSNPGNLDTNPVRWKIAGLDSLQGRLLGDYRHLSLDTPADPHELTAEDSD